MSGIVTQNVLGTSGLVKAVEAAAAGAWAEIKSITSSDADDISFVNGTDDVVLDDTYPIYVFKMYNCHGDTDAKTWSVNFSVDAGSNYNVTKTTTSFNAFHQEDDGAVILKYKTDGDHAQGTGFQNLTDTDATSSGADESSSGTLWLFEPSSTTFTKHFVARVNSCMATPGSNDYYVSGYCNDTDAVDAVQFKMSSGTLDGTIKLFGIKDS